MLTHPRVQEKAQEELDEVIGRDRLPEFSDRESLPYVNAIVKEVLRWYPNTPLGIPHATTEEDDYKGMRIPKGSLIIMNVW
jgi:cytochrome P450